uniref:Uncharacterized protein n=1 Tax=Meloidogyne incognita TaxID=6306 RepID=A0A914NHF8_MELIC
MREARREVIRERDKSLDSYNYFTVGFAYESLDSYNYFTVGFAYEVHTILDIFDLSIGFFFKFWLPLDGLFPLGAPLRFPLGSQGALQCFNSKGYPIMRLYFGVNTHLSFSRFHC